MHAYSNGADDQTARVTPAATSSQSEAPQTTDLNSAPSSPANAQQNSTTKSFPIESFTDNKQPGPATASSPPSMNSVFQEARGHPRDAEDEAALDRMNRSVQNMEETAIFLQHRGDRFKAQLFEARKKYSDLGLETAERFRQMQELLDEKDRKIQALGDKNRKLKEGKQKAENEVRIWKGRCKLGGRNSVHLGTRIRDLENSKIYLETLLALEEKLDSSTLVSERC